MVANQTSAFINLEIFDDDIPEIDEMFTAIILNPVGGATLGDQVSVPVTILTNDDAHGIIGFEEVYICTCSNHHSNHHSDHHSLVLGVL